MKRIGNGRILNIKRVVRILSVVFSCLLLPAAAGLSLAPQKRKPRRSAQVNRVSDLYRTNCARCHGAGGQGDTPLGRTLNAPDFTDQKWWQQHAAITDTHSLFAIVTRGKGSMPAFNKKLNRSEINILVTYVRRFRNQSGPTNSQ
jgi:mono/diheme cytochrome c family protein